MKVLIIGDKPSKHNTDPNIAFVGTRSGITLDYWFIKLDLNKGNTILINRVDRLILSHIYEAKQNNYKIVTLGKKAHNFLGSVAHFELPHPSGLNRKLNNKEWLDKELETCKTYIYGTRC